jgi:hypothetical protein
MKRLVTSPIILALFKKKSLPLALGLSSVLGFLAAPAEASPPYPATIKSALGADSAPDCLVCHTKAGGDPVDTKPFGVEMKKAGLKGGEQFKAADDMQELLNKVGDSDKGGEDDVDELKAGRDPSDDSDDSSGGASGAGGGASGAGGGSTGGGGDDDDDDDDDGGSSGNPGTSGQATSAGCSYGVLDSTTRTGTTAALVMAAGLVASLGKRRKRR